MAELIQRFSLRDTLAQMEQGDTIGISFAMVSSGTVRSAASILGAELSRKYGVHINHLDKTYDVTRYE